MDIRDVRKVKGEIQPYEDIKSWGIFKWIEIDGINRKKSLDLFPRT